jgi:HEAT repeat protein/beta-lactamase regulating signal transducer with metallopeptidase domain
MSPLQLSDVLDAVVKTTLVLGSTGLLVRALPRASAATRHFLWTLGVVAALLLPTVRALAPRWDLPVLPAVTAEGAFSTPGLAPELRSAPAAPARPLTREGSVPPAAVLSSAPAEPLAASGGSIEPAKLLTAAWLVGALAVAVPFVMGTLRVGWLRRRAVPLASPEWTRLRDEIAGAIGIRRKVALLQGGSASMPMAFGVLRPAVLLPGDADSWPEARRRAVLTHELAHVKRHDCLTQALAHAACALYWFHPLAWLAARRLRVERERACDDLVLGAGARGPDYADDLLHLARVARAHGGFAFSAVAMARPSQLEGRLLAILDPSRKRRGPSRLATAAAAGIALLLMVGLAGVQPWMRPAVAAAPAMALAAYASAEEEPAASAPIGAATTGAKAAVHPEPRDVDKDHETNASAAEPAGLPPAEAGKVAAALTGALADTDKEVRQQAVFSLGQMRAASAAPALATALADADSEVRAQAAFALGQIRAESAVGALTTALKDADDEVRQQAVFALGQIGATSAVEGLIVATRDKNAEVRQQAVFALGQIHDARSVPALVAALGDADAEVRGQAAFALGQVRSAEAVGALIQALKDPETEVREQAAFALGQVRDPKASEALTAALKDKEPEVRRQAAFALGQIID